MTFLQVIRKERVVTVVLLEPSVGISGGQDRMTGLRAPSGIFRITLIDAATPIKCPKVAVALGVIFVLNRASPYRPSGGCEQEGYGG
jgi:hypothetical protein